MPVLTIIIVILVVGVLLWLINSYIPMQRTIVRNSECSCHYYFGDLAAEGIWCFGQFAKRKI